MHRGPSSVHKEEDRAAAGIKEVCHIPMYTCNCRLSVGNGHAPQIRDVKIYWG